MKAVERKKKKIENTVVVDRPHARKHGIKCGEPCPRLELYEQFPNGVEGLRLWHNTNARKGQRLAYFDIVKKVETYGDFLEFQAASNEEVEALEFSGRTPYWVYSKRRSPAYLMNNGAGGDKGKNNCRIVDPSRKAGAGPNKVWVVAQRNIGRGRDLLLSYGSGSSHHAKIRSEKASRKLNKAPAVRSRQAEAMVAHWAKKRTRNKQAGARLQRGREQARRSRSRSSGD